MNIVNKKEIKDCQYTDIVERLKSSDFCIAETLLKKNMVENIDSPIPHNLYAILCELNKDYEHAKAHYLAALALDPSYTPAIRNLDRIAKFYYTIENIDYGDVH